MREFKAELAGREIVLAATFGASIKIAKEVGDPLMIAREANLENMMLSNGMTYHPRWNFNIENIPKIIFIGMKEAKATITLEEVQEMVFEAGFAPARDVAVEYLALIVGPQPTEEAEGAEAGEGN